MSALVTVFLFSGPLILLSWIVNQKYVLKIQIAFTSLFLLYFSPLSFLMLSSITLINFYWLRFEQVKASIKLVGSVFLLAFVLFVAKIINALDDNWLVPLGMSYYIFRNLHYTIDVYLGKIRANSILNYLAYNFFLPVLLIGPINKYNDFIIDWQRRRFNPQYFSIGLERILFGIAKVFILGNYIFTYKASSYINSISSSYLWTKTYLESLRFIFNAYYQFAGYSDIAIGLSLLMGYRINENFNNPFWATNMSAFWARYHMSLSSFCKDYIYEPIASYFRKPTFGILVTMLVIALWHQINFQYLIWGTIQTIGIYVAKYTPVKINNKLVDYLGRFFVINFFAVSCVLISNHNLAEAIEKIKILFFLN